LNFQLPLLMGLSALGVVLRQRGHLQARHAAMLFALVINAGLPALMIGTISRESLQREFLLLPVELMILR
jgi:predicted permease